MGYRESTGLSSSSERPAAAHARVRDTIYDFDTIIRRSTEFQGCIARVKKPASDPVYGKKAGLKVL